MGNGIAEAFTAAARLNRDDDRREGNLVRLGEGCDVFVTGDLHGNRKHLQKILALADLPNHPERRLILQELIHGPLDPKTQQDRSVELLLRAARLKINHPQQVLFVLGNHDLAQFSGGEISKEGRGVCKSFRAGVEFAMGDQAGETYPALMSFLQSLPLAVRCPGGTFISHSLPSPGRLCQAGTDILTRPATEDDWPRGKPLYEWTWGRAHTQEILDALAEKLDATFFVLGHKHMDTGYEPLGTRAVNIVSDVPLGVIFRFPGDRPIEPSSPGSYITRIAKLP